MPSIARKKDKKEERIITSQCKKGRNQDREVRSAMDQSKTIQNGKRAFFWEVEPGRNQRGKLQGEGGEETELHSGEGRSDKTNSQKKGQKTEEETGRT